MNITTIHSLKFDIACEGDDVHRAAVTVINRGAQGFKCAEALVLSKPLPEGGNVDVRHSAVVVNSEDKDTLESFMRQVDDALTFMGVTIS